MIVVQKKLLIILTTTNNQKIKFFDCHFIDYVDFF